MLRALIARVFALHPSTVRFTRDARGAPGLEGVDAFISTAGCVSEGEAWSAVALSTQPVGIDLEPGPATDARVRWTLTEAYLKALGRGLAVAPEQVRLAPADVQTWRSTLPGAPPGQGETRSVPPVLSACVLLLQSEVAGVG